jgi:MraZ protein
MFYGEYDYKIDEKRPGTRPAPVPHRPERRHRADTGPEKCITAYTVSEWKKVSAALTGSGLTRQQDEKAEPGHLRHGLQQQDRQPGAHPLPAPLREHAGINDDVVIAGANTYLEIWDSASWEEEKKESQEQAWQIIESWRTSDDEEQVNLQPYSRPALRNAQSPGCSARRPLHRLQRSAAGTPPPPSSARPPPAGSCSASTPTPTPWRPPGKTGRQPERCSPGQR